MLGLALVDHIAGSEGGKLVDHIEGSEKWGILMIYSLTRYKRVREVNLILTFDHHHHM